MSGRRLPPLNALRAFEAAARHLSFTRAAEELNVTQAAVSHQVKALEERLGVRLFERHGRGLWLTDEGEILLPYLRQAFDLIADGTDLIVSHDAHGPLSVTMLPTFAVRWFIPRLRQFQIKEPEIEVRMVTTERNVDFAREDVDCGIRYGTGDWPGLDSDKLFEDRYVAVCNPELLTRKPRLNRPEDLRHQTLLHESNDEDWRYWLSALHVAGVDGSRGLFFDSSDLAMEAAAAGLGVALGSQIIMQDDLDEGRLVMPFGDLTDENLSHWLVYPKGSARKPKVAAFRAWLLEEAVEAQDAMATA
ncbi:MAG: transcriptional regulator GcvA [Alphaproteobacteria bacterium]|jgi:LysR family transcriptional regulator, glycine cleavage system transcriptional activator|nr:transcriptional regulator GcvA [Rhodospirillaceae bacterium]MDG2479415.1 transcriptional regulator GcvA [Alphaproteobacteria bacterium]MBT6202139.1 transcriptional regulator GcvA [Rhodospirillaceae bacterium]MBT6512474.1 transcriptional regulator GcvA [Rhodospirillaceae bacterium]MBT7613843.1 transcriptional regulator GcvA [Rhodospirillaceae bacterium]